jgi:hypothetical protein
MTVCQECYKGLDLVKKLESALDRIERFQDTAGKMYGEMLDAQKELAELARDMKAPLQEAAAAAEERKKVVPLEKLRTFWWNKD